jgi:2-(1,2-epoxy-1,2-dihydrophenyl)acetyl-CoA isomerase
MGHARARRFLICGETLDAEQACAAGLVDFVVEDDALSAAAEAMAAQLAAGPTRAFGEIRRLFATVLSQSLETQLEDEAQGLAAVARSADAREGIRAFVEKRRPRFDGG